MMGTCVYDERGRRIGRTASHLNQSPLYPSQNYDTQRQADPQEAHPVPPTPAEKAHYEALLQAKLVNIRTTMRSTVDYSKREDPSGWPCCSTTQPDCGCDTWATVHYDHDDHGSKTVQI
jgi:hypothetical protein